MIDGAKARNSEPPSFANSFTRGIKPCKCAAQRSVTVQDTARAMTQAANANACKRASRPSLFSCRDLSSCGIFDGPVGSLKDVKVGASLTRPDVEAPEQSPYEFLSVSADQCARDMRIRRIAEQTNVSAANMHLLMNWRGPHLCSPMPTRTSPAA